MTDGNSAIAGKRPRAGDNPESSPSTKKVKKDKRSSTSKQNQKMFLIIGSCYGDIDSVCTYAEKQTQKTGEFAQVLALGHFLPATTEHLGATVKPYIDGSKQAVTDVAFVDCNSNMFAKFAQQGRALGAPEARISYIGAWGIKHMHGLRVAYLSGTIPRLSKEGENPAEKSPTGDIDWATFDEKVEDPATGKLLFVDRPKQAYYTRAIVEDLVRLCKEAGPVDILLTSEWPEGLNNKLEGFEDRPDAADYVPLEPDAHWVSPAVSELIRVVEPRFHFCSYPGQDFFYKRRPWVTNDGKVSTMTVCLGKGGVFQDKTKKGAHAVAFTQSMEAALKLPEKNRKFLAKDIDKATECPFDEGCLQPAGPGQSRERKE